MPAHGTAIKIAMLLKHNGVPLKINLPICKGAWQCKCASK
jgi:hypothetical protein